MKNYKNLDEALCKELEKLDKKYGGNVDEMTVQDVEKADKLYHALKSAETFYAMKEAGEMDEDEDMEGSGDGRSYARGGRGGSGRGDYGRGGSGRSYRRGRDAMGRYTSRDMGGYSGNDGYDGYSGHYPEWMPPYPRY